MTVRERQSYRETTLRNEIHRAYSRARRVHRSPACTAGMEETRDRAARLHAECTAEEPGGPGCLCECHDDNSNSVAAGIAG